MKKLYCIFIILLCIGMIGLSVSLYYVYKQNSNLEGEYSSLEKRHEENLRFITELQSNKTNSEEENRILETHEEFYIKSLENSSILLDKQVNILSSFVDYEHDDLIIFPLYVLTIDEYEKVVNHYFTVTMKISLEEKLNIVASELSKHIFSNLPIEVKGIDVIDGKKVAIINLSESEENQGIKDPSEAEGKTWMYHYFQGTSGGSQTSTALIDTFLQEGYEGEWIDGVKFLHNNDEDHWYGHVEPLWNTIYKDTDE